MINSQQDIVSFLKLNHSESYQRNKNQINKNKEIKVRNKINRII